MGSRHRRARTLGECLYYAVREDFNCIRDPAYRESDDRILPALKLLAATTSRLTTRTCAVRPSMPFAAPFVAEGGLRTCSGYRG